MTFDKASTKLEFDEVALIVDVLNEHTEGSSYDPLETNILAMEVPFYKNYRFLNLADHATSPPLQCYAFIKNGTYEDLTLLDWSYKTIHKLNSLVPINVTEENVLEYVRFYFNFVKGRYGRFIVCESVDNIHWKDKPTLNIKKALDCTLETLKIKEKRADGVYIIKAYMLLKETLFKVDVYVEPSGRVTMVDHKILLNDIPVIDPII